MIALLVRDACIPFSLRIIPETIPKTSSPANAINENVFIPVFSKKYYNFLADNFRSPHLWYWDSNNRWQLRHSVFDLNVDNLDHSTATQWIGNPGKR